MNGMQTAEISAGVADFSTKLPKHEDDNAAGWDWTSSAATGSRG